ncbi:metal-dependent hydrolase family protein [Ferrimonas aestuarii]|uniref:Amidohydrolase family protein n=1 Tax=Ferrimonas aestuarii TaxID=2569539 RepID=A0A4U1BPY5_9GAMM|nr:amidohydrolase family protein [Ferrimonas aestuarii]TKB56194.1 amidohydrolase family protein [Ferrimonas aestuarii]
MKTTILGIGSLLLCSNVMAATVFHVGKLIDGISDGPRAKMTVVVEEGRIVKVAPGYLKTSDGDTLVNLKDKTLLPGFIDMHVHLAYTPSRQSYMEPFTLDPTDHALRGALFAKQTLEAGFTTVRDLGDAGNSVIALRNAIDKGYLPGPRIFAAGTALATTGGHADPTNGRNQALRQDPGPKQGVINNPEDAFKAVRQRYKDGSDVIKLTATGGVLSVAKSGDNPQFRDEELKAVVAAAKDYGFKVAVHAHGKEGMRRAIEAGVNSIEHGTYMDDALYPLMKQHGTWYVPTLTAGAYVAEMAAIEGFYPEVVRPKAARIGPKIINTFGKAYAAGVPIAFGTDAGVFPHGDNAREFALMVKAGMPEMEAIKSATVNAATLLGAEDQLGSISEGRYADMVVVEGDPLENIAVLEQPFQVYKGGSVVYQF